MKKKLCEFFRVKLKICCACTQKNSQKRRQCRSAVSITWMDWTNIRPVIAFRSKVTNKLVYHHFLESWSKCLLFLRLHVLNYQKLQPTLCYFYSAQIDPISVFFRCVSRRETGLKSIRGIIAEIAIKLHWKLHLTLHWSRLLAWRGWVGMYFYSYRRNRFYNYAS